MTKLWSERTYTNSQQPFTCNKQGPYAWWANSIIKAICPQSRFAKESVSLAVFPHARVVSIVRNSDWLVFIFRLGKSPAMQRAWLRKLETDWTLRDNGLVRFRFKVRWDRKKCQWPNDPFPFGIFLFLFGVCVDYDCLRCVNLNLLNHLWSSVVHGTVPVRITFVFSGNGSIRAAIFIRHLSCLTVEKWVYNSKDMKADRLICASHMPIFVPIVVTV